MYTASITEKEVFDFIITDFNVVRKATSEDESMRDSTGIELGDGKYPDFVVPGSSCGLMSGKAMSEKLSL